MCAHVSLYHPHPPSPPITCNLSIKMHQICARFELERLHVFDINFSIHFSAKENTIINYLRSFVRSFHSIHSISVEENVFAKKIRHTLRFIASRDLRLHKSSVQWQLLYSTERYETTIHFGIVRMNRLWADGESSYTGKITHRIQALLCRASILHLCLHCFE